ncbi:sugar ABC transporter substrate-binding protein [Paenibacillus cisolokensis]|uniref:ABC transporter substrate-binding protein n=1 Tax=Paenibacillus cisolokensis TaxID=1658519 RepID=UPI003D274D66
MLKRVLLWSSVILLSLSLAACSGSGSGDQAQDGGTNDKVTIRLSTWAGADEAKELQEILDELNSKSSVYEIVQDSNPAEYDTRILTQLTGQSGPDLFWVSAQRASQFTAQNVMLDITDRLKEADHPAANVQDYYDASLQPFTYEDKLYGLPWLQQPIMLYVNKHLFDEAGVAYPDDSWTWDDFVQAATKLTKDTSGATAEDPNFNSNSMAQWGFTVNGWPPAQMFIWQNGGEVIAEDFSESPIDSPEATEALKFYAELVNGPLTPPQQVIRDRGFDQMFRNGQVAMFMGGAADDLDSTIEHVEAFRIPAGRTGIHATFADILGMGINAKTKHPDAAFAALLDLTDAIHHWKIMPPRESLADLATLQEMHPEKAHSLEAIIDSMEHARPYRYFANYPDWDNVFWNQLMEPIVNAGTSPDELIPKVKPLLDNALSR